jgi:serine/threonine-protein kinase
MYEATSPGGLQTAQGGVPSSVTRSVSLWVSEPFDRQASEAVSEFMRRTELSASIDHPAVIDVLDLGRAHGRVYFVTPPVNAITFDELVRRDAPLPPDDAIAMLMGMAGGLDTAHAAGLVHGAISPTTIWVESSPDTGRQAKVVGFGLEALLRAQARGSQHERLLDDVLYIAPERLRGDDTADGRADQYALACALYHCVAGRPPFARDRMSSLFGAHMLARPEPLMNGDGNGAFGEAIATGMAKDAELRFDSCTALLEIASGGRIRATPLESRTQQQQPQAVVPPPPRETPVIEQTSQTDRIPLVARPASEVSELSTTSQAEAPRARRRRRSGELMPWVTVGLVLLAVVAGALLSLSVLRDEPDEEQEAAGAPVPPVRQQPAATTAAAESGVDDAAVVVWERDIGDEAVTELQVDGVNAVAATGNNLTVVNPLTGSRRWRKVADFGILTDLVAVDDVVVYRTDVLSGVSLPFGTQLWENPKNEAPRGSLTSGSTNVYAVGPGSTIPEMITFDPRDGDERWHFHGQEVKVEADATVSAAGDIIVILQRGVMFGVDPQVDPVQTGTEAGHVEIVGEKWRVDDVGGPWPETLTTTEVEAVFALENGDVCAYALADGDRRWCEQVRGVRDASPGLTVQGETVVVATPERIVALDLGTGDELWTVDEEQAPFLPLVVVDNGTVTVPDGEGTLHTFALSDGAPEWQADGFGEVTVLAPGDGGVIMGNDEGRLARVAPPGATGS